MSGKEVSRILLGHPSCPREMRSLPEKLKTMESSRPVGLVFPPVTPALEDCLETVLEIVRPFEDVEITANDWGTLARTAEWKRGRTQRTGLILGMLLSGQESDPVIALFSEPQPDQAVLVGTKETLLRWVPPPAPLRRHWAEPSAFHLSELLRDMGVDEIELGLQPLSPMGNESGFPVRQTGFGLMSVKPCREDCAHCAGPEILRGGRRITFDRNLLRYE